MACCKKNNKITVYVNSSAQKGGNGEKKSPFSSLQDAFYACKKILAGEDAVEVTLSMAEGTYVLSESLRYGEKDMGNLASRLAFSGVKGRTLISSCHPIDAKLFEKIGENLYAAKLTDVPAFRYLYVDGKMATMAHHGSIHTNDLNQEEFRFDRYYDAKDPEKGDARKAGKVYMRFDFVKPLLAGKESGIVDARGVEWHNTYEWDFNMLHIDHFDLDDIAIYEEDGVKEKHIACYLDTAEYARYKSPGADNPGSGYGLKGRAYWLRNSLAFVDSENEYYLDTKTDTLYFYTEGDILSHTFAYPMLDRLFDFERVHNVSFEGITFTGTDDMQVSRFGHSGNQSANDGYFQDFPHQAAIYSEHGYGLMAVDCDFYNLACYGIRVTGRCENLLVKDSRFVDLGAGGVCISKPITRKYDSENGALHARIENNLFLRNGAVYFESAPIVFTQCHDCVITRNTIIDAPYSGLSVGWSWGYNPIPHDRGPIINNLEVEISYNYVSDFMKEIEDGGGIYICGGNAPEDDTRHFNKTVENVVVFSKNTGSGRGVEFGMYYDGGTSNWLSLRNVVAAQSEGADPDDGGDFSHYDPAFLRLFRERRRRSVYFYSQPSGRKGYNNWSFNILHKDSYFIRARKKTPEDLAFEAHYNTICPERKIIEEGMHCVPRWEELPMEAARIITAAGAKGFHPDLEELKKDRY